MADPEVEEGLGRRDGLPDGSANPGGTTASQDAGAVPPGDLDVGPYPRSFYDEETAAGESSSREVVGLLLELLAPRSVVDVGCGTGAFLREFRDRGMTDYLGIEGPWVAPMEMLVDRSTVLFRDLNRPVEVDRSFDLALCLEVAEHLDAASADGLVDLLVRLAPVIAFSAAVPFQHGSHHVNLRWPAYWQAKFRRRGYVPVDCLRRRLSRRRGVSQFYVQNVVLYVREDAFACDRRLAALETERVRLVPVYLYSPGNPRMSHFLNLAPSPFREGLYVAFHWAGIV